MGDRVDLRGLEIFARHGVFDHEQTEGQVFLVDVGFELDLSVAGASDRLADTIDYGMVTDAVHEVVAAERWDLIERVATRVAETVLALDRRIGRVEVTVHKPDAPLSAPVADVAVTILRSR